MGVTFAREHRYLAMNFGKETFNSKDTESSQIKMQ